MVFSHSQEKMCNTFEHFTCLNERTFINLIFAANGRLFKHHRGKTPKYIKNTKNCECCPVSLSITRLYNICHEFRFPIIRIIITFWKVTSSLGLCLSLNCCLFVGQVMFSHYSDQMSVFYNSIFVVGRSRIECVLFLNVFIFVFLLVRSCLLINSYHPSSVLGHSTNLI